MYAYLIAPTWLVCRLYEVEVSCKVDDVEVLIVTNTKISRDFVDVYTDASNEVVGAVKETTTSQQEEGEETETKSVLQTIATLKKLNSQVCRCDFLSEPGIDHLNGVAEKVSPYFSSKESPPFTLNVSIMDTHGEHF